MRRMISVVASTWASRRSAPEPATLTVNGSPTRRTILRRPGWGSLLAPRPDGPVPETPIGTIRAPVRRARIVVPSFALLERPGRAAGPLGEDDQDVALVEDPLRRPEGVDVARTAADADDRVPRDEPAQDRPVERLLLAEPVDPPAERRRDVRADERRIGVGDVVRDEQDRTGQPAEVLEPAQLDPAEQRPDEATEGVGQPDEPGPIVAERPAPSAGRGPSERRGRSSGRGRTGSPRAASADRG